MFVFSYVQNWFQKKKKKIVYKANKKFRGVIGGISRVVGELEFL